MTTEPEFRFELRTCRWAERAWPPHRDLEPGAGVLVARQLGTRRRRWDTVVVEVDVPAFERRLQFGPERLDSDLLHVVRNAPADWAWYRDALPDPGYPWRYVREAVHRAADREILRTRRDGNRIEIQRRWPYPDWVNRIVAVENKPDLDASAARALADQLERDVALALADEVWLATTATGERVEPGLLADVPVEAGVLVLDFDGGGEREDFDVADSGSDAGESHPAAAEPRLDDTGRATVEWNPATLDPDATGVRILERPEGGEHDRSAARFEYVPAAEKAERRLVIAERAVERGWRSYVDTMRPDCRYFQPHLSGEVDAVLPWCAAKERGQTAAECAGSCPHFEPEPPAWRSKGWPIEGGPGKAIRRLLDDRRERVRPGESAGRESTGADDESATRDGTEADDENDRDLADGNG